MSVVSFALAVVFITSHTYPKKSPSHYLVFVRDKQV